MRKDKIIQTPNSMRTPPEKKKFVEVDPPPEIACPSSVSVTDEMKIIR